MRNANDVSTTLAFHCARCVRDGVSSPVTLALVGPAGFEGLLCNPAVAIRSDRKGRQQAVLKQSDTNPLELKMGWDEIEHRALLELATKAKRPVVDNSVSPDELNVKRPFRAPFRFIRDGERHMTECPRGHRQQVTWKMLVRLAEEAWLQGDDSPTL